MLDAEGNANDADEAGESAAEVTQSQPPARHNEPDHIAQNADGASSQICSALEVSSVDGLSAEGPKGETADHPATAGPGKTHHRDGAQHCNEPPAQRHGQASQDDPQQVEQGSEHDGIVAAFVPAAR